MISVCQIELVSQYMTDAFKIIIVYLFMANQYNVIMPSFLYCCCFLVVLSYTRARITHSTANTRGRIPGTSTFPVGKRQVRPACPKRKTANWSSGYQIKVVVLSNFFNNLNFSVHYVAVKIVYSYLYGFYFITITIYYSLLFFFLFKNLVKS